MNHVSKIAYLPIEFSAREFHSKIALASHLIANGFAVLIGQQWEIYNQLNNLQPGIFLFKSHNKIHQNAMLIAKNNGHKIISLEEEVMALSDFNAIEKMSSEHIYDICDYILCNGQFEYSFHKSRNNDKAKLKITGNPRIDLLKDHYRPLYKEKINKIIEAYGNFILINTNFAFCNSIWDDKDQLKNIYIKAGGLNKNDSKSIKDYDDYLDWENASFKEIDNLVKVLSEKIEGINIVVRPHPGENFQKTKEQYKGLHNVSVVREGSHVPWTLASSFLVHTSCTTGLEAAVASKKAISIVPYKIWYSEQILSNKVNYIANNYKDAFGFISQFYESEKKISNFEDVNLEFYLHNAYSKNSIKEILCIFKDIKYTNDEIGFYFNRPAEMQKISKDKCSISINEVISSINNISFIDNLNITGLEKSISQVAESLFYIAAQ